MVPQLLPAFDALYGPRHDGLLNPGVDQNVNLPHHIVAVWTHL